MECNIFARLEIHLTKRFSQKTYLNALVSCNNAVCLVNKAKSQLFRSILNFNFFKITWISSAGQPACQPACKPACQPTVRPGCARCRAPKITLINRLLLRNYESVVLKTIFLLCHGDSLVLPYITFFSIDWNA